MKKLALLDIDNTVFDSGGYRITLFEKIYEAVDRPGHEEAFIDICQILADEMVHATGMFDTEEFLDLLFKKVGVDQSKKQEVLEHMFKPEYAQLHIFPEVMEALDKLSKIAEVGILSQGEDRFQRNKLTGFLHYLNSEHIHIHLDKKSEMDNIIKRYRDYRVYYVDDILVMLSAAKSVDPNVFTIWSKRGKYAMAQPALSGFTPDAVIENLKDAVEIIEKN